MARTFGCEDIGEDWCPWRMFVNDGEDQLVIETTLHHAEKYHPELVADPAAAEANIQSKISDLLRQSKYYEQKSLFDEEDVPTINEDGANVQVLPGLS